VLAGPGDRRDEDLRAIAEAVAGRFDHYICRRDDSLRDRAPDEVPRLHAATLQARGVPEAAIAIIPDEQEAIDAALNMGQPGDLLLIFADALTRSWKQIIKFRSPTSPTAPGEAARSTGESSDGIGGFIAPAVTAAAPSAEPQRSIGATAGKHSSRPASTEFSEAAAVEGLLPGLIRDERGVRLAPETDD